VSDEDHCVSKSRKCPLAHVADGWKHFAAWWNNATGAAQVYVNGALEASTTPTNSTIAYSAGVTKWSLPDSGLPGNFSIADLWFDSATAFDLSVSANLQKFINGGNAVDLGTTCQLPTCSSPIVCMKGAAASWLSNVGTGGGFTLNAGTLTNSSSNPP
jgi:hypothetical protein